MASHEVDVLGRPLGRKPHSCGRAADQDPLAIEGIGSAREELLDPGAI
jgi:hypothetical protein